MSSPQRVPWGDFPSIVSHSRVSSLRNDSAYLRAVEGDFEAARALVGRHFDPGKFRPPSKPDFVAASIRTGPDGRPELIPIAFALAVASALGAQFVPHIRQSNAFPRDRAPAPDNITTQPIFEGLVPRGSYVIVQDHVHLGSSIANMRGFLIHQGASVVAATALSTELFSADLAPEPHLLSSLNFRFGHDLEKLPEILGFQAATLTTREAYFLNGLQSLELLRKPGLAQRHDLSASQKPSPG